MRRAVAIAAGAAVVIQFLAGPAPAVVNPRYGSRIDILTQGPVATLDPARATTPAEIDLVSALFEGLVRPGPDGPEPAAAASWEVSADRRAWTFHLVPGLRFSDGAPVNAAAFLASWQRLDADGSADRDLMTGLSTRAVDERTIAVEATSDTIDVPGRLGRPAAAAVHEVGEGANRSLTGGGPFKLGGLGGGTFLLAARPDFHGGCPLPAQITYRLAAGATAADAEWARSHPTISTSPPVSIPPGVKVVADRDGRRLIVNPALAALGGTISLRRLDDLWIRPPAGARP